MDSLRDSYATDLNDLRVDVMVVSRILGQSTVSATQIHSKVKTGIMKIAAETLDEDRSPATKLCLEEKTSVPQTL